jgi:hypothetical protein
MGKPLTLTRREVIASPPGSTGPPGPTGPTAKDARTPRHQREPGFRGLRHPGPLPTDRNDRTDGTDRKAHAC